MRVLVELKKIKTGWKKLESGSFGYIIYIVLGVVAAYGFYFVLSLVLGTNLPVVAVVSGSMDHSENNQGQPCGKRVFDYENTFDNWWDLCNEFYESNEITKEQFRDFSFSNGFQRGDMPIVQGKSEYQLGDVIIYSIPTGRVPIIHRIIKLNDDGTYQTKGDHNLNQLTYESSITQDQIHGNVIFIIPKIGYIKVFITDIFGV